MSSSESFERTREMAKTLELAASELAAAVANPRDVPDEALQNLLMQAIRVYGAKAEDGLRSPFPRRRNSITADDVMVAATDMLHALNVQLFELSMWQAMTGNSIAPHQRVDD